MPPGYVFPALMAITVLGVGLATWNTLNLVPITWMRKDYHGSSLSFEGWWYICACLPLFQIAFLRCLWRWCLWFVFVARAARLNFRLFPAHPDNAGGFSLLGHTSLSFSGLVFGGSAVISGTLLHNILHQKAVLNDYLPLVGSMIVLFLIVLFGPLLIWVPKLTRARNASLQHYGRLVNQVMQTYEERWLQTNRSEEFLDASDAGSAADLGSVFNLIEEMRPLPFRRSDVFAIVIAAVAPMLPLVLTAIPLMELLQLLAGALF